MTEIWRSSELNVQLLFKDSDPQNGQTVRRLVNIRRGEPDPALFEIPADYTVTDTSPPR